MILVVEDDAAMLKAVTAILGRAEEGFQVLAAEDGAAGLETFLADPDAIDLVLADLRMPHMNGLEMAQRMKRLRPDARIVLMSVYPESVMLKLTKLPYIRKPFLMKVLLGVVREHLAPRSATA